MSGAAAVARRTPDGSNSLAAGAAGRYDDFVVFHTEYTTSILDL